MLDPLVRAVAPPPSSSSPGSVRAEIIVLCALPMLYLCDYDKPLQLRCTFLLMLNVFVRLLRPSQPGLLASPITARAIATVAEFAFYEVWAVWCGAEFWGHWWGGGYSYLWLLVLCGEFISWTSVIFQSEYLCNTEDTTWAIHGVYMARKSNTFLQLILAGGFSLYMLFVHLPRRFKRAGKLDLNWYFTKGTRIRDCEFAEKAWVVPMLLGQPLMIALCYYQINN